MVLHKRLDYVYSGCQVPPMPHLSGSAKGKRSVRKKVDDNPMFAFDLLATVAGKILEREKSAIPFNTGLFSPTNSEDSFKPETSDKAKPLKVEAFDCRCYNNSTLGFDGALRGQANLTSGELPPSPNTVSGHASVLPKSEASDKVAFDGKPTINDRKTGPDKCSTGRCSLGSMESHECKVDVGIKTPDFLHLNSGIEVPQFGGGIARNSSIPKCGDGTELAVDRDDDENSSGCTHRSTIVSKAYRPQRIGGRRIRKLLGSKLWKVAPTKMDGELSDTERKPVCRSRKMCYTQLRAQRCSFKRRKLSEHRTVSSFDGREGTSKAPVKSSIKVEASYSRAKSYGVRFSIKSFKVPELVIEMPETATVGSLRRTVMETVTSILEGGLHVGVFLHGKKVKDDNKTLLQAGLSLDDDIGNVGFMLEPNPKGEPPPSPTNPRDPQSFVSLDEAPTRIPAAFSPLDQGTSTSTLQPPVAFPESDHDSVHSPTDASANSKDLISLPSVSIDGQDVVPLRKSDLVQRRIRRPFSVSEVESLVQAVEKLGTGRWRDVKLRAFDNAKHRTYVDLKDKWKTLVHTAKISPQQRRGEPVPQELLDRVLGAHSYWAQQLTKLQPKSLPHL